jgi:mercuric ion transport protein
MDVQTQSQSSSSVPARAALAAAAAAALLASACCLAPLALVLVGVSGAWIGQLAGFEPYQPYFLIGAAVALAYAGRKIWSAPACDDGRPCAVQAGKRAQKFFFVAVAGLMALVLGFPLIAPFFY